MCFSTTINPADLLATRTIRSHLSDKLPSHKVAPSDVQLASAIAIIHPASNAGNAGISARIALYTAKNGPSATSYAVLSAEHNSLQRLKTCSVTVQ